MIGLQITQMPAKLPKISTYTTEEIKLELEKIAHKQGRSLSNLVAFILREYVEAQKVERND